MCRHTAGYCLVQHKLIIYESILPRFVSIVVKTILNPMWRLAFSTQKCCTGHHSTVFENVTIRYAVCRSETNVSFKFR